MVTISLRIPEEELKILKDYARIHNTSLSPIIRNTMMDRIEDEFDLKTFLEYEANKAKRKLEKIDSLKNFGKRLNYDL